MDTHQATDDRPAKCTVEDGRFVRPCWALSDSVAGSHGDKRKGVIVWSFINFKTGEAARTLYGIRSGQFEKNGVVFNHCPFCGESLEAAKGKSEPEL